LVNGLIKNTPESFLILDDSVQNKQYSKSIEPVKKQYSGAVGGLVRGIGVVNLVHSDGKEHYPVDYRIYDLCPRGYNLTAQVAQKANNVRWQIEQFHREINVTRLKRVLSQGHSTRPVCGKLSIYPRR